MDLKQITIELIDKVIIELKSDENMEKIKSNILKPFINYIIQQIYPYLIISVIIFVLTLVLFSIILILLLKKN
jgi:hypothetical protein